MKHFRKCVCGARYDANFYQACPKCGSTKEMTSMQAAVTALVGSEWAHGETCIAWDSHGATPDSPIPCNCKPTRALDALADATRPVPSLRHISDSEIEAALEPLTSR